jgi:hypothetical protein
MGMTPGQCVKLLVVVMVAVTVKARGLARGCLRGFVTKVATRFLCVIAVRMGVAFGLLVVERAEEATAFDP